MNAYYLINADRIEQARQYAPMEGLPNQLFQCVTSSDGTRAIVQAEWSEKGVAWLNENGVFLGELQPDGNADFAVYKELVKSEWLPLEEY